MNIENPHWTYSENKCRQKDRRRVMKANHRTSFSSKEARTARRLEKLVENKFFEKEEGPSIIFIIWLRYCRITVSALKLLLNMNKVKVKL